MKWSILLIGLAGCFTPPTGIRSAEEALAIAEAAGAADYLPVEHATVQDLLAVAHDELARQETVSIQSRSYRRANRMFAEAERRAVRLKARAIARKAEVESMIVPEMQMLMVTVQQIEADGRFDASIRQATDQGRELGVSGTPTFFINGRRLVGIRSAEDFVKVIEEELKRVG